ncbi:hypothetical protein ACHAXN_002776 [Cyclotella atomus]
MKNDQFTLLLLLHMNMVEKTPAFTTIPKISGNNDLCRRTSDPLLMIGTGFSFNDGEQILVSVQKPLGLVLEQDASATNTPITVAEVDTTGSASRAGVQEGDVLLAVQNMSVESYDLEQVLRAIGNAPRVVNLRLLRGDKGES